MVKQRFVGNWPGVTVEKKEGKLKGNKSVTIMDLPGIYSLSPYTLEEVVARTYLITERPDAILNIVDGTNLERNLYLTTQILELGIPVVVAVNMADLLEKTGEKVNLDKLSEKLGCPVVSISALKGTGIKKAAEKAVELAEAKQSVSVVHEFAASVESAISSVEDKLGSGVSEEQKRFFAIKVLEKDDKIKEQLSSVPDVTAEIKALEDEFDDDTESIITNERYTYISSIIDECCTRKKGAKKLSVSDKIDKVVTNRFAALPIFIAIMFLVYYISMVTVGSAATDWANDGLFGDGWHLFGIGSKSYEEAAEAYGDSDLIIDAFTSEYGNDDIAAALDAESDDYTEEGAKAALEQLVAATPDDAEVTYEVQDEETLEITDTPKVGKSDLETAVAAYLSTDPDSDYAKENYGAPDTAEYGVWVPGIPVLVEKLLDAANCVEWLRGLILDGIVAGVGAVLGFVPQMLVLFLLLAFLEACGYMARIAFVLDRIFRRFGLSGKSFIPILIGTGCGIPGIMASRTIENERDRRMTIMTTTFIPCGAKQPFIAMIAGAIFGGSPLIISGIMLKKTKMFSGEPAPFVMELPAYHWPTIGNLLRSMWERGWSFIKKAGTIILLSTILVWFTSYFGWVDGSFGMLAEEQMEYSILAHIGKGICWIFKPLGWGNWQATVASVTGLVAKENIVATMGILYGTGDVSVYASLASAFSTVAGMSFLVFNLLCAPCFAAIGAIKREMNSPKWTWFAIGYQCGFAYVIALMINQFGSLFKGNGNVFGVIVAVLILAYIIYMLFRPYKESDKLNIKVKTSKKAEA